MCVCVMGWVSGGGGGGRRPLLNPQLVDLCEKKYKTRVPRGNFSELGREPTTN